MYREYGEALKLDLVSYPGLALEPESAARLLAFHFKKKNVQIPVGAHCWSRARLLIHGDLIDYQEFRKYIGALMHEDHRK